jgi:hypothetical protein
LSDLDKVSYLQITGWCFDPNLVGGADGVIVNKIYVLNDGLRFVVMTTTSDDFGSFEGRNEPRGHVSFEVPSLVFCLITLVPLVVLVDILQGCDEDYHNQGGVFCRNPI